MGHYVDQVLPVRPDGTSRADRVPLRFRAYVPSPLADLRYTPPGDVMERVAAAAESCSSLSRAIDSTPVAAAVTIGLLSRSEGVGSATVEDYHASSEDILKEEASQADASSTAAIIATGISVTREAVQTLGTPGRDVTVGDIERLQVDLMTHVDEDKRGLRTTQNWLGSRRSSPVDAAYVPPPPHEVDRLMADLCEYINLQEDRHPLVRAAIAHSQFILIHPFADGNGRVGRALIHTMLRREGLTTGAVVPVSLAIQRDRERYISGVRSLISDDAEPSDVSIDEWVADFSGLMARACSDAESLMASARGIHERMRDVAAKHFRSDAGAGALVDALAAGVGMSAGQAAQRLGVSDIAAMRTLSKMEDLGLVACARDVRPYVYYSQDVAALVDATIGRAAKVALPAGPRKSGVLPTRREQSCGVFMPRARTACVEPLGHTGPHRSRR